MEAKRCVAHACFFLPMRSDIYMTTKLNILFAVGMGFPLVSYLKLAWNSVVQRKLGCFGLPMEVKKVLRSEKSTQTKKI